VEHSAPAKTPDASGAVSSKFDRWWPVAVDLWIVAVILLFFALRIFDSNTAQRIFHSLAAR
jgi:hypothetical protein